MTTLTAVKQEKTGLWASMFPNDQVSEQQSALFVKKLLAIAVSNIVYLRAMFPEQAFGDRCLEELNLKILREDTSCPGACQVIKWMKACFDAVDKKYLEQLIIGIYMDPKDLSSIIESYTFKFSYMNSGIDIYRNNTKVSSAYHANETKKATIQLLRTIIVLTQTLKPLPDEALMTIKLFYYDEVTPADYEPPGFKATDLNSFHFQEPMNIKMGNVSTPFHLIKLRIKTNKEQFGEKDSMETTLRKSYVSTNSEKHINRSDTQEAKFHIDPTYLETDSNSPLGASVKPLQIAANKNIQVKNCPCGYNQEDGLMIHCDICKYWQHAVCFKILSKNEIPKFHVCESCAKPGFEGKNPTDSSLMKLSPTSLQTTCMWRRVLLLCTEESKITLHGFTKKLGLENTVAHGLFHRLESEGFIKKSANGKLKRSTKIIDPKKLAAGLQKYFSKENMKEDENCYNNVDTLSQNTKDLSLSEKHPKMKSQFEKKSNLSTINPTFKTEPVTRRKRTLATSSSADEMKLETKEKNDDPVPKWKKASLAVKSIIV
ncbi:HORMA domain-containing protein 1-like [Octopus sinensis]|uniref:HORMA domain-containing protein 1-like n=1 Tax=Octopus sinensis TaxID=2607531 RepID=A0A7E6EUH8_9MOLL|nr:HORMA domain-containing protein 1-like [Octopus sinensis]XP_036358604.1 HORMA domain-containing protein 1-like [Octopus sinensis]XP_036358605.1 HORMA domain-containing protein 1-like [Octopus sinensis]